MLVSESHAFSGAGILFFIVFIGTGFFLFSFGLSKLRVKPKRGNNG